ncbi:mitochondrial ribosomal protein S25-domain-containing protein [Mycena sp. CBHHK59/15]|nr:mitochondrial ribosomal protein S25-domain-containing protein [Mycena sp. CBHHK59/15]
MGRRIASQVHHQVSRLMQGNFLSEPKWYQPSKLRRPKTRPLPIHYIEDDIRRQFFADHPFEAFRPTTLVEKGDIQMHEVNGARWTRLRQRGRNPTPEDAIQFALNLHQHHHVPLSQAYARAIAQFRSLRSEHHIATTFAVMEAEFLGGVFVREKRALATWEKLTELDEGELIARKRWKVIAEKHEGMLGWSKGQEYVRLWKAGIKPDYSPALTKPVDEIDSVEEPSTCLNRTADGVDWADLKNSKR